MATNHYHSNRLLVANHSNSHCHSNRLLVALPWQQVLPSSYWVVLVCMVCIHVCMGAQSINKDVSCIWTYNKHTAYTVNSATHPCTCLPPSRPLTHTHTHTHNVYSETTFQKYWTGLCPHSNWTSSNTGWVYGYHGYHMLTVVHLVSHICLLSLTLGAQVCVSVCVCVCVCLLLNISLFMCLFVPQTILTLAADEGWKF